MMRTRILLFSLSISIIIFRSFVGSFASFILSFSSIGSGLVVLLVRGRLLRRRRGNCRKLLRVPVEKTKPRVMPKPVPSSIIRDVRLGQNFRLLWLVHSASKALRLTCVYVPAPVWTQPIPSSRSVSMMVMEHTIIHSGVPSVMIMTRLSVAILSSSSDVVIVSEPVVVSETRRPAV